MLTRIIDEIEYVKRYSVYEDLFHIVRSLHILSNEVS